MAASERHPLNCDGPFYVAKGECMACGAPELQAVELMAHDEGGSCYFAQQPETVIQTSAALRAMGASCCGAVRYGGTDTSVLIRIKRLSLEDQSDHRPPNVALGRLMVFSFELALSFEPTFQSLDSVASLLAKDLASPSVRSSAVEIRGEVASFRISWGHNVLVRPSVVDFAVKRDSGKRWKVKISGPNASVWIAATVDTALRSDTTIVDVQWFEESGWSALALRGEEYPY